MSPQKETKAPERLIGFSDQQLRAHIALILDTHSAAAIRPVAIAAIREVLYLRREIERLSR